MKLASLGTIQILLTPLADNPEIMSVDVIAETRKDPVIMLTNKDETPDLFARRIKSMLTSLLNGEVRKVPVAEEENKELSWEEQKAALKSKR